MNLNAMTDRVNQRLNQRRWLRIAGAVSIPFYVAPVSILGLRGVRPRILRSAISGLITLGVVSIVTWSVSQWSLARRRKSKSQVPSVNGKRWQLPIQGPILPDEAIASAASGH
jgi:hypothetical protein